MLSYEVHQKQDFFKKSPKSQFLIINRQTIVSGVAQKINQIGQKQLNYGQNAYVQIWNNLTFEHYFGPQNLTKYQYFSMKLSLSNKYFVAVDLKPTVGLAMCRNNIFYKKNPRRALTTILHYDTVTTQLHISNSTSRYSKTFHEFFDDR